MIRRNGSLIPSRNEKRIRGVRWKSSWRNISILKGLDPFEKTFAWKMSQDMLDVGARQHRRGAHKECTRLTRDGRVCNQLETLEHRLFLCESVQPQAQGVTQVLGKILGRDVDRKEIMCLDMTTRGKCKLILCLWVAVKSLFMIYNRHSLTREHLLKELSKEIKWNIDHDSKIGSLSQLESLIKIIDYLIKT